MQRFAYTPNTQVIIMNERTQRVIDVSDDLISGSISLRVNAMSTVSLVLQNKDQKYVATDQTTGDPRYVFDTMDRIVVKMSRVGGLFPVFCGYLHEVPFYQLYPGPITIQASDPLYLLQYTYFDPGLNFLISYFGKLGWTYDPGSGALYGANGNTFGNFDTGNGVAKGGGVGDIIIATLAGIPSLNMDPIANWPANAVQVDQLPAAFVKSITGAMVTDLQDESQQQDILMNLVDQIYGVNTTTPPTASGTSQIPITSSGPVTPGNVDPVQLATQLLQTNLNTDQITTALAISYAESSFNNTAVNFNDDHSYDLGIWQINTVHAGSDGRGMTEPSAPNDYQAYLADFHNFPADVQSWINNPTNIFQIDRQINEMLSISGNGTSWSAWTTYNGTRYQEGIPIAQKALAAASNSSANSTLAGIAKTGVSSPFTPITTSGTTDVTREKTASNTSVATNVVKVAVAEGSKGIQAANYNDPDIQKYQATTGQFGAAWCASFVQWVYQQAGDPLLAATNRTASVGGLIDTARNTSGWSFTPTDPQPGDIVVWGDTHTGIVVKRQGDQFWTVEGNSGGTNGYTGGGAVDSHGPYTVGEAQVNGQTPAFIRPPGIGQAANAVDLTTGTTGTQTNNGALTVAQVQEIAAQSTWFVQQTQSNDTVLSNLLTGSRALANDVSFLEWISQIIQSSGRVFRVMPDGTFYAFFPDRFGWYGRAPYFNIADIEVVSLNVQRNDLNLVTHVFTVGPFFSPGSGISDFDVGLSLVASVEDPAFNSFINVPPSDITSSQQNWSSQDGINFLKKYGARPYRNDVDNVRNEALLWMSGWMQFTEMWASCFSTDASFTFLPELFPGGLVRLRDQFTMYIEDVTHTFDMAGGFTTQATLSSLSSRSLMDLPATGPPDLANTSVINPPGQAEAYLDSPHWGA